MFVTCKYLHSRVSIVGIGIPTDKVYKSVHITCRLYYILYNTTYYPDALVNVRVEHGSTITLCYICVSECVCVYELIFC